MIPSNPSRPAKARNIALAFLVGLVGGIGLALMREYLDNTVKTPDDIETLARLPSLAVVPAFEILPARAEKRLTEGCVIQRSREAERTRRSAFAQIANVRGFSRTAYFVAAFAARPSAAGNSRDQRAPP